MHLNLQQDLGDSPEIRNLVILFCSLDAKKMPTPAWMNQAETLIDAIGRDRFLEYTIQLLKQGLAAYEAYLERFANHENPEPWMEKVYSTERAEHTQKGKYWEWQDLDAGKYYFFRKLKGRFFRGAIFCAILYTGNVELLNALDAFCIRLPAHSSDAIWVYSQLPVETGVPHLTLLRAKIKKKSVQNRIDSALKKIGQKHKVSAEQIEEMAISSYGLNAQHVLEKPMGAFIANYRLINHRKGELSWINQQGKAQSSLPNSIKEDCAHSLKLFKAQIKEIETQLSIQKERIENLYLKNQEWNYQNWRKLYIAHPLIGVLGKQLIWSFRSEEQQGEGFWQDEYVVDTQGNPLNWVDAQSRVTLWHPIQATSEQVQSWRKFLVERQITQPFKQAFREVYLLTDAERATQNYSNRYSGHFLDIKVFTGLAKTRGWASSTYGQNSPSKRLPHWNLKAEFHVDENSFRRDMDRRIEIFLETHGVRFYQDRKTLDLQEIPLLIFSEVMRDVDLFVSVANMVVDPLWIEQAHQPMREYAQNYNEQELQAMALTRKEALQYLIPKLKIANKCSFEGNFLRVQGRIRAYKINFKSGNILMEPNDRYLCIVEDRSKNNLADKLYLPFDGDRLLSIILSKALLLADDHKITDPSIIRQF